MNDSDTKTRHHYVWAHYLKRWGNGTKNVYYSTKRLKIGNDSVKSFAFEFHFYRSTKLSKFDIEVIKGFSRFSPSGLQELHEQALNKFLKIQAATELYDSLQIEVPELESAFEAANANSLENMHTHIELHARPIIDELANGNLEVLKDTKNAIRFFNFFGHQATRTKSFKDKIILVLKRDTELEKAVAKSMENSWWFLSYLYGLNMGKSFFESRNQNRVSLLKNNTSIPFITADQPIINVHQCVSDDVIVPPEQGDFFYPLSPTVGFIISDSNRFENGVVEVDETTVNEFNEKLASNAILHIIGNSENALKPYIKFLGRQYKKVSKYKEAINK